MVMSIKRSGLSQRQGQHLVCLCVAAGPGYGTPSQCPLSWWECDTCFRLHWPPYDQLLTRDCLNPSVGLPAGRKQMTVYVSDISYLAWPLRRIYTWKLKFRHKAFKGLRVWYNLCSYQQNKGWEYRSRNGLQFIGVTYPTIWLPNWLPFACWKVLISLAELMCWKFISILYRTGLFTIIILHHG